MVCLAVVSLVKVCSPSVHVAEHRLQEISAEVDVERLRSARADRGDDRWRVRGGGEVDVKLHVLHQRLPGAGDFVVKVGARHHVRLAAERRAPVLQASLEAGNVQVQHGRGVV
jgi:hypothetical protein